MAFIKLQLIPPASARSTTPLKIKVVPTTKVSALVHTYLLKSKLPLAQKDDLQVFLDDDELELTATVGQEQIASGTRLNIVVRTSKHQQKPRNRNRGSVASTSQGRGSGVVRRPTKPSAFSVALTEDCDADFADDGIDWSDPAIAQLVDSPGSRRTTAARPLGPSSSTNAPRPRPAPRPPPSAAYPAHGQFRPPHRSGELLPAALSVTTRRPPTLAVPEEDEFDMGIPDEALAGLDLDLLATAGLPPTSGSPSCTSPNPMPPVPPNTPDQHLPSPSRLATLIAASVNAPSPTPRGFPSLDDPPTSPLPRSPPSKTAEPGASVPGPARASPSPPKSDANSAPTVLPSPSDLAPTVSPPSIPATAACRPERDCGARNEGFFAVAVDPMGSCRPPKEEDTEQVVGKDGDVPSLPPTSAKVEQQELVLDFWGGGGWVEKGRESAAPPSQPVDPSQSIGSNEAAPGVDDGCTGMDSEGEAGEGVERTASRGREVESTGSGSNVLTDELKSSTAASSTQSSLPPQTSARHLALFDLPSSVLYEILAFAIDPLRTTNVSVLLACKTLHTLGRPLLYRTVSLRSAQGWRSFFSSGSSSQVRSADGASRRRDDYEAVRKLEILCPAPTAGEGGPPGADMVLALHEISARRNAGPRPRGSPSYHPFLPKLESLTITLSPPSPNRPSPTDDALSITPLDAFYPPFLRSLSFPDSHLPLVLVNVRDADQIRAAFATIKGLTGVSLDRPVNGRGRKQIEELAQGSGGRIVLPADESGWAAEERVEGWRKRSVWTGMG